MKRYLFVLVAVLTALVLAGCNQIDPSRCGDSLYSEYGSQECQNVRATSPDMAIEVERCFDLLYSGVISPECQKLWDDAEAKRLQEINQPAPPVYPDCSTCTSPTSGGQVMNPENLIQQAADAGDAVVCYDTTNPNYNSSHCASYRYNNIP